MLRDKRLPGMQGAGVLCLMDIAAGMEHLHSLGVLHVSILHSAFTGGWACLFTCRSRIMQAALGHLARPPQTVPCVFGVPASPEADAVGAGASPHVKALGHTSRPA